MTTRHRKVRRQRGSRTCGWGVSGQHRNGGMRGGHGKSGWRKHKWTYTIKYDTERIGKRGFVNPTSVRKMRSINVGELDDLVMKMGEGEEVDGRLVVDLKRLGYDKLLGGGAVSHPYLVRVEKCSGVAVKKIEESGGVVQTKISEG